MDSTDLTPDQAAKVAEAIWPGLNYLTRLIHRMERRHLPSNDKLLSQVRDAQAAMQALHVELHYRSCRSGVGRPGRN